MVSAFEDKFLQPEKKLFKKATPSAFDDDSSLPEKKMAISACNDECT